MSKEKPCKSLFICGYCDRDTKGEKGETTKVILGGFANMLCFSCRCRFEDAIEDVAKKYLCKS